MFNKPFDEITKADIDRLISDEEPEGRSLDYKAELPGSNHDSRKEFAADVASFANGAGGFIIYGISEKKNAEGKTIGLPDPAAGLSNGNLDSEMLRLGQVLRTSVAPMIPGFRMKPLGPFPKGDVLLVYIPRSWSAPHMVTAAGESRFPTRGSAGKHYLDVHEIRSAFSLSAEMPTLIRRFRDERLGRIIADETPVALSSPERLVLHLVPFSSMGMEANIDLGAWAKANPRPLEAYNGWSPRYNFDGFLTFTGHNKQPNYSYFQLFRSGAIESVANLSMTNANGSKYFRPYLIEETILTRLQEYLALYAAHGVELPIVAMVSVLSTKGASIPQSSDHWIGRAAHVIERDTLILPDVLLRDYADDLPKLMRPAFDALWQAAGESKSHRYDENGEWKRKFD